MHAEIQTSLSSKKRLWAGRVISTLVALFLLFDSIIKLMQIVAVRQAFAKLGYAQSLAVPIGILLLVCTALYALPRTSVLGAILLTAYLGGRHRHPRARWRNILLSRNFWRASLGGSFLARRLAARAHSCSNVVLLAA